VSWDWGGTEVSGKSWDGTQWHRFPDGSTALWTDPGNVFTDRDGRRTSCAWTDPCAVLPHDWPRMIDRDQPAVRPQVLGGRVTGDPHFQTQDGTYFSTQLAGEFIGRSSDDGHDIQIRTVPVPGRSDTSLVGAVAIATGDHRITVSSHPTVELRIDGKVQKTPEEFAQIDLSDDAAVGIWAAGSREDMSQRLFTVAVLWPDLGDVHLFVSPVYGITMTTAWPQGAEGRGLLGDGDGDASDDLTTRRGYPTDNSEIFAESWRISAEESLFHYLPEKNTETYTVLDFPRTEATVVPGIREEANKACSAIGIVGLEGQNACVFDVSVTGDPGYVIGHHILAEVMAGYQQDIRLASWLDLQTGTFPSPDLALTTQDIARAKSLRSDGQWDVTVDIGRSRTAKIVMAEAGRIRISNNDASCVQQTITEGDPGYQLFDSDAVALAPASSACSEGVGTEVVAGTYYLKFVGPTAGPPARFHLTVQLD